MSGAADVAAIVAAKRAIRTAALARRDALSIETRAAGSAALSAGGRARGVGVLAHPLGD